MNEPEFVQVFVVREERKISIDHNGPLLEVEKELDFRNQDITSFEETNALELKSSIANTTNHFIKDNFGAKLVYNFDELESISDLEEDGITKNVKKGISLKELKEAKENPKQFICDQCGNQFTSRKIFEVHLKRHSGDKEWACE